MFKVTTHYRGLIAPNTPRRAINDVFRAAYAPAGELCRAPSNCSRRRRPSRC